MKNYIFSIILLMFININYAQNNDQKIINIQTYIQETSQNAWFDPINNTGNLTDGTAYDLSYYSTDGVELFSVIYTTFGKINLRKVFYYQDDKVIAAIIEETDPNNANKLLKYADYFYENQSLINLNDSKKEFPVLEIYNEGIKHLNTFKNIISNK